MKPGINSIILLTITVMTLQNCRSLNSQNQHTAENCKAVITDAHIFQKSIRQPQLSYAIDTAYVVGQTLKVDVSYNDGCATHDFVSIWDGSVLESDPPIFRLTLKHEKSGEGCERSMKKSLCFSIGNLGEEPGILQLQGWSEALAVR